MTRPAAHRRRRRGRRLTRRVLAVAATVVALLGLGTAAWADPAGPTHYRSTITEIGGDGADALELEVLGGDAFLVVRVAPGHQVEVSGYEGEPYLRIGPDGVVEVNERSPARWLNDDRFGLPGEELPTAADAEAPPLWTLVGRDGVYAWHDHRIHWMSPGVPPSVDPDAGGPQLVQDWTLELAVDGEPVTVAGQLHWVPGPSPLASIALPAALLILSVALVLWRPTTGPLLGAAAAVAGSAVGIALNVGLPPGADGDPALLILPPLGAALLVAGTIRSRRRPGAVADLLTAAGGFPLLVWGVLMAGSLVRPIVPEPVATSTARVVTALVLAGGVATVVGALRARTTATAR